MNPRRILVWLSVALVLLYLIEFPEQAAQVVRGAGDGLVHIGSSLVDFVGSVV